MSYILHPLTFNIFLSLLQLVEPLLPYALAFAAGAMVYVVIDDIIPEGCARWVWPFKLFLSILSFFGTVVMVACVA